MMNNSQGASSFFSGLSTLLGRPHPLLHNLSDTTRTPLTKERVLRAAVDLADLQGLGALSMRKLGQMLGVEAMSGVDPL